MKIPISAAKAIADQYQQTQVIVFAWDGKQTHIATYGKSVVDCDQAAQGANAIKKQWGWPDETLAEPSRVKQLREKIKQLEAKLNDLTRVPTNGLQ